MDNNDYDVSSSSSESESEAGDVDESVPVGNSNVELTLVDDESPLLIQPDEEDNGEDGAPEICEYKKQLLNQ